MLNSLDFLRSDYSMIFDLMRPDLIWVISTKGLLPFCIAVIIIIFLIQYYILKRFFIKRKFTIKNYLLILISSLVIYYISWVILLTFFAIILGQVSQNL